MEYIEADPLPIECQHCGNLNNAEWNCEECDCLGLRFRPSDEDQRRLDRIMAERRRQWRLKQKQSPSRRG